MRKRLTNCGSRRLYVCGVLAVLLAAAQAHAVPVAEAPLATPTACVGDGAAVVGAEWQALVQPVCVALSQQIGAELAVITVDNLDGRDAADYAAHLFERLKPGRAAQDNGVLILFARQERRVQIEVGYGLEAVLPDALAGQLLDQHAVPHFKTGDYARGLYEVTRAAAQVIAQAAGATLPLTDPATFPAQPPVPEPVAPAKGGGEDTHQLRRHLVIYVGIVFLVVALAFVGLALRVGFTPSRTGKRQALGSAFATQLLIWGGGFVVFLVLGIAADTYGWPLLAWLGTSAIATALHLGGRAWLARQIAGYTRRCPACRARMQWLDTREEKWPHLDALQRAEEEAGGMCHELWRCSACDKIQERFAVKRPGATACPTCKRRTVVETRETVLAATTERVGREQVIRTCKNPQCDYKTVGIRNLAKLATASSAASSAWSGPSDSPSSGGSSGSSSGYGGGESGGGGAGRGW